MTTEQLLLGCQKYKLGAIPEGAVEKVNKNIDTINLSKKTLFLVNLVFKYVGVYDML